MKYLKKFNTHSDYETFTGSTDFIRPNVSCCVNEYEVHFNPIVIDPHEYVDLGLPSGTLWATENIKDANGNELYFAWGETQGYTSGQVGTDKSFEGYGDDYDYLFGETVLSETDKGMTKYNITDGKRVLEPIDDAATVNWGTDWKMPTKEQFEELIDNTTTSLELVDGIYGVIFTSTNNGNTLFFPFAGYAHTGYFTNGYEYDEEYDEYKNIYGGCYFSSSVMESYVCNAWALDLCEWPYVDYETAYRYKGGSIRPVRASN